MPEPSWLDRSLDPLVSLARSPLVLWSPVPPESSTPDSVLVSVTVLVAGGKPIQPFHITIQHWRRWLRDRETEREEESCDSEADIHIYITITHHKPVNFGRILSSLERLVYTRVAELPRSPQRFTTAIVPPADNRFYSRVILRYVYVILSVQTSHEYIRTYTHTQTRINTISMKEKV